MRLINKLLIFVFYLSNLVIAFAQTDRDSTVESALPKPRKFGFAPLPVLGYNSDIGFQYGLIFNLFYYGDRELYPEYIYSVYTEVSRTTKGGGINQLFFDSKHLLPYKIRVTADLSYLTELALNFYGFNGYESVYNRSFIDDDDPAYISRMFYNHQRRYTRITADFQGKLVAEPVRWLAGMGYFNYKIRSVDIDNLNKGKPDSEKLPVVPLLYDQYIDWGIIRDNEKTGGIIPSIKLGLVYDTRDNEPSPTRGMWSEALFFIVPKMMGNQDFRYVKLSVLHRQYMTLLRDKLTLAFRVGYQGTLTGSAPFFIQPYMITSFAKVTTTDGLGGEKTIRGILRNRIVGDGIAYGNIEFRWRFYRTFLFQNSLVMAFNLFGDGGQVVKPVELPADLESKIPEYDAYFSNDPERIHGSYGFGLKFEYDHNLVVAVDYGRAIDRRDGLDGFYLGIGYLF